jgi:hypothetical protein
MGEDLDERLQAGGEDVSDALHLRVVVIFEQVV